MLTVACFLVGLGVGIVLNSLADNLPPDQFGFRNPPRRPHCRYCGAAHAPLHWLALVSFLARRGRCEHCTAPRRLRHVVVELVTGLSLAGVWLWAGGDPGKFVPAAIIAVIFILITVIDVEHRLILHVVVIPSAIIVGLIGILTPNRGPVKTLVGGLGGYGLVLGVFFLGQVFSLVIARLRGQALDEVAFGGGDVNLAGVVGLTLGWPAVLLALFTTVVAAGLFSFGYVLVQSLRRRYSLFTPLPYGPFLALGALLVHFYGKEFAAWLGGR